MANQFLNAQEYANTMLLLAKNRLVTGKLVSGKFLNNQITDENGLSISVKRPPRFARNDSSAQSAALAAQDILTGSVNVAVDQYAKVHISVGDIEYVQSYNQLMQNETMKSAASTLAHQFDAHLQRQVAKFSGYIGTATLSTDPCNSIATPAAFNRVHTRLMNNGVPNSDLVSTLLFDDAELIRGSLLATNIQGINRNALEKAQVPILSEIDVYATQQCPSITVGTRVAGATTLINNGTLSVNYRDVKTTMAQTITVDGQSTAATFVVGEHLTIAGVYAYDWRNSVALPYLQVFEIVGGITTASGTIAAGAAPGTIITSDTSGAAQLIISPPIIVPNTSDGVSTAANTAFATCSAAPADESVVTHLGVASTTLRVRAAWTKPAITLVSAQLQKPFTGESSFANDPETGISIRYWRGSDISTGAHVHRWDAMFGAQNLDPLMGYQISGS